MAISIESFAITIQKLESALLQEKNEFIRDSVIQRFKFCIELAWKISKKLMGSTTSVPKDVIKEMAQNHYIEDIEIWLTAIDKRNLCAHTYNEELAEEVYVFAKLFIVQLQNLIKVLGKK